MKGCLSLSFCLLALYSSLLPLRANIAAVVVVVVMVTLLLCFFLSSFHIRFSRFKEICCMPLKFRPEQEHWQKNRRKAKRKSDFSFSVSPLPATTQQTYIDTSATYCFAVKVYFYCVTSKILCLFYYSISNSCMTASSCLLRVLLLLCLASKANFPYDTFLELHLLLTQKEKGKRNYIRQQMIKKTMFEMRTDDCNVK